MPRINPCEILCQDFLRGAEARGKRGLDRTALSVRERQAYRSDVHCSLCLNDAIVPYPQALVYRRCARIPVGIGSGRAAPVATS